MNTSTRALVLSMLALVLAACGSVPRKGASPASAGNGHAAAAPVAAWPAGAAPAGKVKVCWTLSVPSAASTARWAERSHSSQNGTSRPHSCT